MKTGKIETLVRKYDFLMRSEVWEAGMLIYQGINFLFFTNGAFSGTAFGVAIPVGLLALGVLLDLIFTKKLIKRENLKSLIMALIFGITSIFIMRYPQNLSEILHYGIAAVMIVDGFLGLLDLLHFKKIREKLNAILTMGKRTSDHSNTVEYNNAVIEGISEQRKYMLISLDILKKPSKKHAFIAAVISVLGIVMGVMMIVFHDQFGTDFIRVSGACLLVNGLKNLVMVIRNGKLKKLSKVLFSSDLPEVTAVPEKTAANR